MTGVKASSALSIRSVARVGSRPVCVCVPARDEADRLPTLLAALADQDLSGPLNVVVSLNNTTDASSVVMAAATVRHAGRLILRTDVVIFPRDRAHAGSARRRAMDLGLARVGEAGVLLTTDADARPPGDWARANLDAVAAGADMVGGRLTLDEAEPAPAGVSALRAAWDRYWARVRAVEDAIDPRDHDPAPRHGDHTGASLAITAALYRTVGGVPAVKLGEDRALVAAGVAAGGRLVHPMSVWTRVSPRRDGRAPGGMAADMAGLHAAALAGGPVRAPALEHWRERALWRRRVRAERGTAALEELEAALPPMPMDAVLDMLEVA